MILVISTENDISTDYFMEWCFYYKIPVIRINETESLNVTKSIFMSNGILTYIEFNFKEKVISLSEINAVWFRRGYLHHFSKLEYNDRFEKEETNSPIDFLKNESKTLNDFVIYILKQKRLLSCQSDYNANKLIVLYTASRIGLKIPDTVLTRNLEDIKIKLNQDSLITKAIQDAIPVEIDGLKFAASVHEINSLDDYAQAHFYYSKFQKRIYKKYELRIFFIDESYYAGAIFPNNNEDVLVKRIVPFLLPEDILNRLKKLNKELGFNTGSIDMIVDEKDDYFFLEINPVGQYDYLSKHCNYYLDLRITEYLQVK